MDTKPHHSNQKTTRYELSYFDERSPRSLVKLLPGSLAKRLRDISESENGHLLGMPEPELRRALMRLEKSPTATDDALRKAFWEEYEKMQAMPALPRIDWHLVLGFTVSKEYFYRYYATDPHKLIWLFCPPVPLEILIENAKLALIDKYRGIIADVKPDTNGRYTQNSVGVLTKVQKQLDALEKENLKVVGEKKKRGKAQEEEGATLPKSASETREERRKRLAELQAEASKA